MFEATINLLSRITTTRILVAADRNRVCASIFRTSRASYSWILTITSPRSRTPCAALSALTCSVELAFYSFSLTNCFCSLSQLLFKHIYRSTLPVTKMHFQWWCTIISSVGATWIWILSLADLSDLVLCHFFNFRFSLCIFNEICHDIDCVCCNLFGRYCFYLSSVYLRYN